MWRHNPVEELDAHLQCFLFLGPVSGIWEGEGSHPRPPGREEASGVGPAGSAHPGQTHLSPGSVADNQCGKTSGLEATDHFGDIN